MNNINLEGVESYLVQVRAVKDDARNGWMFSHLYRDVVVLLQLDDAEIAQYTSRRRAEVIGWRLGFSEPCRKTQKEIYELFEKMLGEVKECASNTT
jgi:hypothetical protein